MEHRQELYEVVCLSGGVAVILFSMVHLVLLPGFRILEGTSSFEQVSFAIPRTYLLHDMQKSHNLVSKDHSAVVSAR